MRALLFAVLTATLATDLAAATAPRQATISVSLQDMKLADMALVDDISPSEDQRILVFASPDGWCGVKVLLHTESDLVVVPSFEFLVNGITTTHHKSSFISVTHEGGEGWKIDLDTLRLSPSAPFGDCFLPIMLNLSADEHLRMAAAPGLMPRHGSLQAALKRASETVFNFEMIHNKGSFEE